MLISQIIHEVKQCAKRQTLYPGKAIHAHTIKSCLHQYGPIPNSLIDFYGKCSILPDAVHVFDELPRRDLVSWASILTAHNQANLPNKSLSLFLSMFNLDRLQPDHFVFASLVKACAGSGAVKQGKQVHALFIVSPFNEDDVVKSSLVDMYSKCGLPDLGKLIFDSIVEKNSVSCTAMVSGYARNGKTTDAIELFRSMPIKTVFTWSALISGFIQSGNGADAFDLFNEMRREGVIMVDSFIISSIIGASANLAVLELGKQIHGLVIALGYDSNLFVNNSLVDMYAKCSDILTSKNIFDQMLDRDVVSWTSVIVGLAQHGRAEEALLLYDEMILHGIKPNEVTFVGLIYACSHVGLVEKGRKLFKSMIQDYKIEPSVTHYTCLLDLLSRSGHLEEAENVIKTMPIKADEAIWAALLSACKRYGKTQMGIRLANHILGLNPEDPSTYILISNAYAGAGMWENVSKVRKLIEINEFQKKPGYSSIDLGKEIQVFYAGEIFHPMKDSIFNLLQELDEEMRKRGYVPDVSSVLHDMDQLEKERQLFWHSERVALAYGLLKAVPGTVIRIVKNLRVCSDCHVVLKYVSEIVEREIVVRDANRFHHFKHGVCSCKDFW